MKSIAFLFVVMMSTAGLINCADPKGIVDINTLRAGLYGKDPKGNTYLRVVRNFFQKGQDLDGAVTANDMINVEQLERKSIVLASDGKPAVRLAIILNDETDITLFKIGALEGTIDTENHTVALEMPNGTDLTALTPIVLVSQGAKVSPLSGAETDFTNPVTFTVTADDGTSQEWTVTVTEAA